MTVIGTSPRDLPGIGTYIESRLRDVGITSIVDLAAADAADLRRRLGVRGLPEARVREWIRLAAEAAAPAQEPDAPRREAFVVTVHVAPEGRPLRTTVRNVRDQSHQAWTGWDGEGLLAFLARQIGAAIEGAPARSRPVPGGSGDALLDAGHLAGGRARSIELRIDTAGLAGQGVTRFDYDAEITARPLGSGTPETLGRLSGSGDNAHPLVLRTAPADLPPGVHRVQARIRLSPGPDGSASPALSLAGS